VTAYLIDTSAPGPAARLPRARVLIGGTPLAGLETAYVESTGYYQADTFAISLALDADPAFDAAWWGAQADVRIELQAGFATQDGQPAPGGSRGPPGWQTIMLGQVDRIGLDLGRRAVLLNGRDLACLLIDAKTTETFVNQSAAQVASVLAPRHGLTANCSSPAAPVGQFYQVEHSRQTLATGHSTTTEWDLLVRLAKQDGADLWVSGTALNLQPQAVPTLANSILLAWQPPAQIGGYPTAGFTNLMLRREQALAKDITVQVQTWEVRHRKKHTATVSRTLSAGGHSKTAQTYVFNRTNLTPDKAMAFAQTMLAQLTKHERRIEFSMPGEMLLTPRCGAVLAGTGTPWDQTYYVTELRRRYGVREGFWQRVCAINQSPASVEAQTETTDG
jgi:hypothetical protein